MAALLKIDRNIHNDQHDQLQTKPDCPNLAIGLHIGFSKMWRAIAACSPIRGVNKEPRFSRGSIYWDLGQSLSSQFRQFFIGSPLVHKDNQPLAGTNHVSSNVIPVA